MIIALTTYLMMAVHPAPSVPQVRDTLSGSVVTSSLKRENSISGVSPVTSLVMKRIEERGISSPKELSSVIPGLNIPDYGTSMTSTIYVRGLGSRMDNPVIGLYIDDVPVLDKNCYDFSFIDVRRVDFLHGPQGTLYGRNSMLGVLSVETLSPDVFQGVRLSVEYGSAATLSAKASAYKGKVGFVAAYNHTDGFFVNEYDGSPCGLSDSFSARLKYSGLIRKATVDNTLTVSYTDQSGYPYRRWISEDGSRNGWGSGLADDGSGLLPVNYNDRSGYKRFALTDGFRVRTGFGDWSLSSVTSLQTLFDSMDMDQDFTPSSMFTLNQTQRQVALTQEFILRPRKHPDWWDSQTGVFGMAKLNRMGAPVRFLQDGIKSLILDNANAGIPKEFGELDFLEDDFPITSDFGIFLGNVAVYHESYFRFGRWTLAAGLRLDFETGGMDYDSSSDIHFILSPAMPDYIPFSTEYKGRESVSYAQLQPKASLSYDAASRRMEAAGISLSFSASVSKGYRSGGFNTQIFSDILQNKMMTGMMDKIGVHLDGQEYSTAAGVTYKPEMCLDYEAGGTLGLRTGGHILEATVTAYRVDCRNQQMTVFPYNNGTGRIMANAGKSRSVGAESEVFWSRKGLSVTLAASVMDARFIEYNDGRNDWSGNRIPYSPESSVYLRCGYKFLTNSRLLRSVAFGADYNRTGSIVWNEAGDLTQEPYSLAGADLRVAFPKAELWLRMQNLADTDYSVFYFKSVGNSFFQTGKPRRVSIGLSINL